MQTAHASGPPDLVIAGLTVVDPIVAVLIGCLVLGEAAGANGFVFSGFGVAGAVAIIGVIGLARYHPQVLSESQEIPIKRGSSGPKVYPTTESPARRPASDAQLGRYGQLPPADHQRFQPPAAPRGDDRPFDDGPVNPRS